jgi:crotonobetainyl-CoA:carnitine CoA-transferase CaiB-like acyl-CoA transferase
VSMLTYPAAWYLNGGVSTGRTRHSSHPSVVPFGAFPTAEGWLVLACPKEHFWRRLTGAIDRPELATDPRFVDMPARQQHRDELKALLDNAFAVHPAEHWVKLLKAHGVPCAPVRTMADALDDPYCADREMLVDLTHPHWGRLRLPATAARVGDARPAARPAPALGADTDALLSNLLRLPAAAIDDLRTAGAFGPPAV